MPSGARLERAEQLRPRRTGFKTRISVTLAARSFSATVMDDE
jgi:hypothetical protein